MVTIILIILGVLGLFLSLLFTAIQGVQVAVISGGLLLIAIALELRKIRQHTEE